MNSATRNALAVGAYMAVGAIATDLDSYAKSKAADPKATYDWSLMAIRALRAFLGGFMLGAGYGSAVGPKSS